MAAFEGLVVILGIGFIALLLAAIVLMWVLERTVFRFKFCDHCKKQIDDDIRKSGGTIIGEDS